MKKISILNKIAYVIFIGGLLLPVGNLIPVKNATKNDWNKNTYWYEPWGISGVHKGVDIFSKKGADVISPGYGMVIYTGEMKLGGKVILTLNARWQLHYFAHLNTIQIHTGVFVSTGDILGSVGDSGNAKGKQPHLHYSIVTPLPYFWQIDDSTQGWKKMFFLNPLEQFPE